MAVLPRPLLVLGAVLLMHASYSAYEHTALSQSHLAAVAAAALAKSENTPSASSPPSTAKSLLSSLLTPAAVDNPLPHLPLLSSSSSSSSPWSGSGASLPLDITIETLVAVFLLALGVVRSSAALRPVAWAEWAAGVEAARGRVARRRGLKGNLGKGIDGAVNTDDGAGIGGSAAGAPSLGGAEEDRADRELAGAGFQWLEKGQRMGFTDIRARRKEFAREMRGKDAGASSS